jgi:hypothetical protein
MHVAAALLTFGLPPATALAAQPDGPYVLRGADGGWQAVSVAVQGEVPVRQSSAIKSGNALSIPAVGAVPSFTVKLRGPANDAAGTLVTSARTPGKTPVFVVADTHGEYEILVGMLRAHRVLGSKLEWKFGCGHLVVLGDVFDRGPNHLEILWLLYKLEAEARKAGGGAHLVLGNHELMAMRGDLRYLHPKYADTARTLEVSSYARLFAADTLLGQWLRSRPAVLKLDDMLYLHGGISRALVDSQLSLADVNATVRSVLRDEPGHGAVAELVMGMLGPLWYRGYFADQQGFPIATSEDVELALKTFGVRRIFVGHTIVPTITPLYGGRVYAVQVYPRRDESGATHFESLRILDGMLARAMPDGTLQALSAGP